MAAPRFSRSRNHAPQRRAVHPPLPIRPPPPARLSFPNPPPLPPPPPPPFPPPPSARIVPRHWLRLPESTRGNRRSRHALLRKKIPHRIRPPLRKRLVEFIASHAVRVPFNLQVQPRMRQHNTRNLRQLLTRPRLQRIAPRVEQHIGHVHNQPARRIPRLQNRIQLRKQLRAKLRLFRFRLRRSLPRLLRLSFCGSLLRHSRRPVPRRLLCCRLSHLLLLLRRRASLLGFLLLPNCIFRSLLRFLLHPHRFRLPPLSPRSRLIRLLPALYLCVRISARPRLAFQCGSLFRRHRALRIFLGLLFHRHHARFFRRLHDFACRRIYRLFIPPGAIHVLRALQLLICLAHDRRRVLIRQRDARDSHRIARLKQLQRRFAVDPKNRILNLRVRRRVNPASQQLISRIDILNLRQRVRRNHVLQHHHVPRLRHREIRLRPHNHPEPLHGAHLLHTPGAMIQHHLA